MIIYYYIEHYGLNKEKTAVHMQDPDPYNMSRNARTYLCGVNTAKREFRKLLGLQRKHIEFIEI